MQNEKLKEIADLILKETDIVKDLSMFGKVHVLGSYAFNLMSEPDIDIIVITNTPKESSESALSYISKLHKFQKIEYGNFQKFPRENRPPFFILNMKIPFKDSMWEIETWFLPEAEEKISFTKMMKNISNEQRNEIIKMKEERRKNNIDKKTLSSYEIYKKVLRF